MRDISNDPPRYTDEPAQEPRDGAIDRRGFIRGAVAGAVVGAVALAPAIAEAKRCLPVAPKKGSRVRFTATSEDGAVFQGRMDLDTVETTIPAGSTSRTLSVELFFDTYEKGGSIVPTTTAFANLALVDADKHRPPLVMFAWGKGLAFRAIVEGTSIAFTAFLEDGTPVGAIVVTRLQIVEECAV